MDRINGGFVGLDEDDYYWLTEQIVKIANKVCEGRVISVLEGGYRLRGMILSAFAQSVTAHVRALIESCTEEYDANTTEEVDDTRVQ